MKRRLAFTLTELLVVIAIVALLAGIAFPVFAQAKRAAHVADDVARLRSWGQARALYLADHDDRILRHDTDGLVALRYIPSALAASRLDAQAVGLGNVMRRRLEPPRPTTPYRLSYLTRFDVFGLEPPRLYLPDAPPALGWMVALHQPPHPAHAHVEANLRGQFSRLLMDGAVVRRTIVRLPDDRGLSFMQLFREVATDDLLRRP